jgi:hypothetical protein
MIWHFHVQAAKEQKNYLLTVEEVTLNDGGWGWGRKVVIGGRKADSVVSNFKIEFNPFKLELFNSSTRVLSKHPHSVQYPPIDLSKHPHPVRVEDLKLKSSIDSIDKVEFNFQVTIEQHELYFLKSVLVISMSAPF